MLRSRLLPVLPLLLVILASCCPPEPVANECDTMQATIYIGNPWAEGLVCGEVTTIAVVSAGTQDERAKVREAADEVHGVLDGGYGLPVFTYDADESQPTIPVNFEGTGSLYYGRGEKDPGIVIYRTNTPSEPGEAVTVELKDLHALILHETVQIFGFKEQEEDKPALADCAIEVPPHDTQPPLNSTLCSHEKQSLYAAFHLRDGLDVDLERELVSVVQIQPSRSELEIGEQETFVPVVDEAPVPRSGVTWLLYDPDNSLDVLSDHRLQFEVEAIDKGLALLDATLVATTAAEWPWPLADAAEIVVDSAPPPPADVDNVAVVPTEFDLDQSQPFVIMQATAFDAEGDSIPSIEFEWESSDRDVAEVQPWPGETNKARVTGCWLDTTRTATITATASGTTESASAIATVTNVACR